MTLLDGEHPDSTHRALNALGVATLIVTLAVLVVAGLSVPITLDASSTTDELASISRTQACSDRLRAEVINATAEVTAAKSRLDLVTNAGLEASVRGDDATLNRVAQMAPRARAAVTEAVTELDAATRHADEQTALAVDDPDEFLAQCEGR